MSNSRNGGGVGGAGAAAGNTIDALLSRHVANLRPGESICFTLVKGTTVSTVDPLLRARAAAVAAKAAANKGAGGGGNNNNNNKSSVVEPVDFPRIAKFIETVQRPDFDVALKNGKMYEEDIPKAKDESDEEDDESEMAASSSKKKKRWKRHLPPRRHWILQERTEFLQKMAAKRMKRQNPLSEDPLEGKLSSRYEGVIEGNPSHYVALSVDSSATKPPPPPPSSNPGAKVAPESLTVLPIFGFHSFTQPAKFATLSMHEAERAITDQRNTMTRYMMHSKSNAATASSNSDKSRARLFGRLHTSNDPDKDDADVMSDLAFRSGKGATLKARKELLTSLGEGLTVDDDGVIGGANDSEFARGRRFGQLEVPTKKADGSTGEDGDDGEGGEGRRASKKGEGGEGEGGSGIAGTIDGMAMDADFYQRDVGAEYEEMDYDANEQFDDDDVDIGQDDIPDTAGSGFAADVEDEGDGLDDEDLDEDGMLADLAGNDSSGLATRAGLQLMMAKARGETGAEGSNPNDPAATVAAAGTAATLHKPASGGDDAVSSEDEKKKKVLPATTQPVSATPNPTGPGAAGPGATPPAGAEKKDDGMAGKNPPTGTSPPGGPAGNRLRPQEPLVDSTGQRVISLAAIQREIWLHHGSITMKQLMKIFNIRSKTSEDRRTRFRELVKELCTMEMNTVEGTKMLVLKQHYSNVP